MTPDHSSADSDDFRTRSSLTLPFISQGRGLRARLMTLCAAAVILPVLVAGGVIMETHRRSLVSLTLGDQAVRAQRLAERVAQVVQNVKSVLSTIASQMGTVAAVGRKRDDWEKLAALKGVLHHYPNLMEAAWVDNTGRERAKLVREGDVLRVSKALLKRLNREEIRKALSGRTALGDVFFTERDRVPQMFVAVPVPRGGGVLLARVSLESLWDVVAQVPSGGEATAYVLGPDGGLIAHPDRELVLAHRNLGQEPLVKDFIGGKEAFRDGARAVRDAQGRKWLAAAHRVPGLPWLAVAQVPRGEALAPIRRAVRRAMGLVGMGVAVFLVAALWLAGRILSPLHRLQENVKSIASGDLSQRLQVRTGDELESLAGEFNRMADALATLEQTKRDLTHMIVHDLKSPLSSILGSLDYTLLSAKDMPAEYKKLLTLGAKAGRDLLRMIQNLLDMGKMEEGKMELKRESFTLRDLAAQCVDDLEANMYREGKVISVEIAKDLPKMWADRDLLHRVLSNLLTNALKHTGRGAEIAIRGDLSAGGRGLVVSVKDTGEGIPPEFQEKIFEKYGQAEARKQNFRVGVGLGLAFCKLAVDSHDGRIWVESEVGKGSEFFVEIPLPTEPPKDAVAFPDAKLTGK